MTIKIGQSVNVRCPKCADAPRLMVFKNSITGRLFLGCPNYYDEDEGCEYTRDIPTDIWMRITGQPALFTDQPNMEPFQKLELALQPFIRPGMPLDPLPPRTWSFFHNLRQTVVNNPRPR